MNFSEPIKISNGQIAWSECGYLLASTSGPRLTIWDAATLQVLQVYSSKETLDFIQFSPDSNFILAACYKAAEVYIYSVNSPDWNGRLSEGLSGLVKVEWTQDSRHIVTASEFFIKQTFWSLTNKSISYIRNPKQTGKLVYYNKDKSLGLVVERQNGFDTANILTTQDWSLLHQFPLDTDDMSGAVWCPLFNSLAIWDSPLKYRLLVYSQDGRVEFDYCAYEHQLGVKTVTFSPSGHLLAAGSHDGRIRIFSTLAWTLVHEINHYPSLHEGEPVTSRTVVYEETDLELQDPDTVIALELGGVVVQHTKYNIINERPVFLDFCKVDPKKSGSGSAANSAANIKVGVGSCQFSKCGRYIASRCDNLPTVAWIWDLETLKLAALAVHKSAIKQMQWDSAQPRLGVVTGGAALYFWTPLGCVIGRIPPVARGNMSGVMCLSWNKRSKTLILNNKESAVICRLKQERKESTVAGSEELDLTPSREREREQSQCSTSTET